eukprot:scaffold1594_cov401-Prasinococcus_capsulatus_cf.AAC.11
MARSGELPFRPIASRLHPHNSPLLAQSAILPYLISLRPAHAVRGSDRVLRGRGWRNPSRARREAASPPRRRRAPAP